MGGSDPDSWMNVKLRKNLNVTSIFESISSHNFKGKTSNLTSPCLIEKLMCQKLIIYLFWAQSCFA